MTNHDALQRWYDAGCTALPVAPDGTKRPAVNHWRQLQHHRPDLDQLQPLWDVDSDGVGIICGAASDNLEMLELEAAAVLEGLLHQLAQTFTDHGHADLWNTIASGCVELTPSGGMHLYYRTNGPTRPNTKLASRPATEAELAARPGNRIIVLIETRGQGGWSVVAPSAGRSHPTGGAWTAVVGGPTSIPTITDEQRDTIHDLCRLLDQTPTPEPAAPAPTPRAPRADGDLRPGDDYNARARWEDILGPHGWQLQARRGKEATWIRPGKGRGDGISATTGHSDDDEDRLYVFSSAAWPFEPEVPYTKFGAYALLEHNGDHAAAARTLQAAGYGTPPHERRLVLLPSDPGAPQPPQTNGTAALAPVVPLPALQPAQAIEDNEDALARAFVAAMANHLHYVPQRRQWLTWTGARWEWDEADLHREHIKDIARRLPSDTKTAASFRRKMLSSAGISGVANLARTDPRVVVHLDRLDNEPWELNTPAGVVNLRTGQISPPTPTKLHTRSTAVAPDFDTQPTRWLAFLDITFGGDQAMIDYVQRLMGVAAVGEVLEQSLPFGHGVGANGKSVFVETCTDVLGRGERGYAIAAQAEMLMARKFQEHSTELAQLAGARLVVCSELEDGARFAEARVKQLTGRDSISARFMRRDFFTFTPSHTFLLVANHKPQATVGGPAFWRRLRLIPFNHVVPEEQRDAMLPEKLKAEWPAILAWIIRGAAAYAADGMRTPDGVLAATAAYARDEDTLGRFVEEECHLAPSSDLVRIQVGKLRSAYEQACKEHGDEPVSARRFTQELRDRFGIESVKSTGGRRYYIGITVLEADEEDAGDGLEGLLP